MALVVAAKELVLFARFAHEKQQVTIGRLEVQHFEFRFSSWRSRDLEELTLAVGPNVQRNGSARRSTSHAIDQLHSCAHTGKLDVEQFGVHDQRDRAWAEEVRSCDGYDRPSI